MGSAWRDLLNYAEFLKNAGNLYIETPGRETSGALDAFFAAAAPPAIPRTASPIPPKIPAPSPARASAMPFRSATPDPSAMGGMFESAVVQNLMDSPVLTREERAARMDEARARVAACTACDLCKTRTQTVYGTGDPMAKIVFVGEAPGEEEDRTGLPFVGRAGKLLTQMIEAIGFKREEVFICNTLKCRPPGNRDPLPGEKNSCRPFLIEQLSWLRPQMIVALGAHAGVYLTGKEASIGKLRNTWHSYHGIPVWATYHPAFLLRSPSFKTAAWEDMQVLFRRYNELNPGDARRKWEKKA